MWAQGGSACPGHVLAKQRPPAWQEAGPARPAHFTPLLVLSLPMSPLTKASRRAEPKLKREGGILCPDEAMASAWDACYCYTGGEELRRVIQSTRRRQCQPTPVLLPGKSHGRRSLIGCGPWGHEESDTTERLYFHFLLSCTGEGNGNPLQCSCLENPRDGEAWWAAVYGVAQSRTQLK